MLLFLVAPFCRADNAATVTRKLVPALGWDGNKQGRFPVSLASDAAGNVWVGTEGNGLWKYDAGKKAWTQFTTKDGLGDDCVYALAVDQLGRVWAGHLNHGVSVYNGDKWKNYGLVDGPIGDRVFAIAVSPKDGDVWMATDMGLARYSEKRQDWDYYSRASGLPSDQIESIAFDNDGNIFVGTQCNGLAIGGADDDFTKWRIVSAGRPVEPNQFAMGMVSNLINMVAICASEKGTPGIIAVTPKGMESGNYRAVNWLASRGADWKDFEQGVDTSGPAADNWLAENWQTAFVFNSISGAWVGYRKKGVQSISWHGAPPVSANVEPPGSVMIRAIDFPVPGQPPLVAAYDAVAGGLLTLDGTQPAIATGTAPAPAQPPPLPAVSVTPDAAEAKVLAVPLAKYSQTLVPGEAYYLADDWRTEGDWVGRYGSGYTKLCGMAQGDQDYPLQPGYQVQLQVGPHHEENAAGPVSYHDDETSDDLRSLYDPTLGHRRDAQENDFSENSKIYSETYNGPDLWVRVKVPDGVHCLSLYFLNNDAHTHSESKYRDYDVQIVPGYPDDNKAQAATPLARTRVTDFWGGVYKQFLVCGPASYVVKIGRNRSYGTRLQAVFVDPVTNDLTETPGQLPGFAVAPYSVPTEPENYHPTPLTDAAVTLWNNLDNDLGLRGAIPFQIPLRIWCYRAAIAGGAPAELLERWRWQIGIWTPEDRKKFDAAMKAAHDALK